MWMTPSAVLKACDIGMKRDPFFRCLHRSLGLSVAFFVCFFVHRVPGLEKTQGQLRIMFLHASFIAFNMQIKD